MQRAHAPVAPGDLIGVRYRVEALLGQGGMAVVYRARHTATGRPCALKLIHPHLVASPKLTELFLREARVGGRIGRSPHFVEVFDAGVDPERGVLFMAMELLEGETLEQWSLHHGPMPPPLFCDLADQLATAVDQAHEGGVIHRDLKPGNLFLTHDPRGRPWLKLMDFGIAKVLEPDLQRAATQVGTPAYAAPEQLGAVLRVLAGRQGIRVAPEVSAGTDVWGLALVAYELLTGHPTGQYWGNEGEGDLPAKIVLAGRKPPSERAGDRAELLPAGFDAWFARATRTDAGERWPSVGVAVTELVGLFASAPIATASRPAVPLAEPEGTLSPSSGTKAGATALTPDAGRRARALLVAAAGALAIAVLGLAVVGFRSYRVGRAAAACEAGGESCEEACDGGRPASCARLAGRLERARGPARDEQRAAGLYARACDAGEPSGCAGLGWLVRRGRGGEARDPRRAVELFRRACDAGAPRGCALLGEMVRDGAGGTSPDDARAAELFGRACDRGEATGCAGLGEMHAQGRGGLPRDEARAASLLQRACDGGELRGCHELAGFFTAGKGGLSPDDRAAAALHQRTCEGGEVAGCTDLGRALELGRGVARDEPRATALYREACDGGDPRGCGRLGAMLEAGRGGPPDPVQAGVLYREACDGGDARGCNDLGYLWEHGRGGLARDDVRAVTLYRKACDGGDAPGCNNLGFMQESGRGGLRKDEPAAVTLYARACDGGELPGCVNLGVLLAAGRGAPRDEVRAVALYQRACDGGNAAGCANLGWQTLMGFGAPRDRGRGVELLRRGCAGGSTWACERLRELGKKP